MWRDTEVVIVRFEIEAHEKAIDALMHDDAMSKADLEAEVAYHGRQIALLRSRIGA